ncbi:MAG TPA: tobe domain protein [Betaproteobacteria bacterium]|nr:tobe domain protein [Betaproteobacteria bacterium]
MNRLPGVIAAVETSGHISLVDVDADGGRFTAAAVGTAENMGYLQPGKAVTLLFKETEVSLAKQLSGMISLRNRFPSRIKALERGNILSKITLDYHGREIVSVITTRSVQRLELEIGDAVEGLVKANEMTLMHGDR